jgi:drug/metabolite transporter (DMT)-like permease
MLSLLIALAVGVVAFAGVYWFAREGFRNGDRPDDAPVRAALRSSGQPGEERPVALVEVGNPGPTPVLAAVTVRRALLPSWLAGLLGADGSAVARRTARRAYRPDGFPTVAVVAGRNWAELAAPVPAVARRYLVLVLVGEADGRLRSHRLRIDATAVDGRWHGHAAPVAGEQPA